MHRSEIALHYAYFKVNGKQYRILSTNYPKLVAGNPSSDFFGFFGLGSGEFWTHRIEDLNVPVTYVEVADLEFALLKWSEHPRFIGFFDCAPQRKPTIILLGGDQSLYDIHLNWEVYTQLGVPSFALETLGTFRRGHVAYETPEEQDARIDLFRHYVKLF